MSPPMLCGLASLGSASVSARASRNQRGPLEPTWLEPASWLTPLSLTTPKMRHRSQRYHHLEQSRSGPN
eukprot:5655946-Alexandrium_andersonii.AAC.1